MASRDHERESMPQYQRQLERLRFLTGSDDGTVPPGDLADVVRDSTNAVIAEAEAMSRATIRAGNHRESQADTFLWVRVARLAAAADHAVDAARAGDHSGLRSHLRHFESLTAAIWTVRDAVYDRNFAYH